MVLLPEGIDDGSPRVLSHRGSHSPGSPRAATLDALGEAPRWSWTGALAVLALSACVPSVDRTSPAATRAQRPERPPWQGSTYASSRPALDHPRLQATVLPSGLRVLLDEDPHATVAGAVTVVPGGATLRCL